MENCRAIPLLFYCHRQQEAVHTDGRITSTFLETYDAGALYTWVKDDLWLKMAMEMDERRRTRMVTVRTTGTSDDNNNDVISERAVHMKIFSDTALSASTIPWMSKAGS